MRMEGNRSFEGGNERNRDGRRAIIYYKIRPILAILSNFPVYNKLDKWQKTDKFTGEKRERSRKKKERRTRIKIE